MNNFTSAAIKTFDTLNKTEETAQEFINLYLPCLQDFHLLEEFRTERKANSFEFVYTLDFYNFSLYLPEGFVRINSPMLKRKIGSTYVKRGYTFLAENVLTDDFFIKEKLKLI